MRSSAIAWQELPGATSLFADYLYQPSKTICFYGRSFLEPDAYRQAASEIESPEARRAALVEALASQNPGHPSLERLARPGTLAVVTGQQVGLFTGPAYSVYKALTAVKLARTLSEQGLAAVPIFWLASEDHDFEEAGQCWVLDAASQPVRIAQAPPTGARSPVGPLPVEGRVIEELGRALAGLPYADLAIALAAGAYRGAASFASGFRSLMDRLLPDSSLLYLDPLDRGVRRLAAPFLASAIARAPELVERVLERGRELEEAGYHAQVRVDRDSSLFFLLDGQQRLPLRVAAGGFQVNGRLFSPEELAGRAEDLSPNALLRPVLQDYLLPAAAMVVGPAEVAYLAQSQVLYGELLGRMPVVVPRAGFTVLDEGSARVAEHYGLTLRDLCAGEQHVHERIAAALVPAELQQRLSRTREEVEGSLQRLRLAVANFDSTLAAALDTSRRKMLYQLWKMERKVSAEAFRRNVRAARQTERLLNLAAPHRHLQERFYSFLALVAWFGPGLADAVYEQIELNAPEHRVLVL
ncbi:MAG: bacillithiol biosynthesis cysteine-adding enzyme BshC [Bryobacteraceae bacterium]|nr:bacillithiol biosynthesis cysteine-adding enzyme BshC [Bryobacteraceae bacterium]